MTLRIDRWDEGGHARYALCGPAGVDSDSALWLEDMGDGRLYDDKAGKGYYLDPTPRTYPDSTGAWGYALTTAEYDEALSALGKADAETQTTINGPYVPTNLTLRECWESDLGQDVDYALLRDNADPDELEILEAAIKDDSIDVEPIEQAITARVLADGRYVRDSKWTREA
jgi:hypothetical protein